MLHAICRRILSKRCGGRFRISIWKRNLPAIWRRWVRSLVRSYRRASCFMSELDIVKRLRGLARAGNGVVLGIGDDCAIYRPRRGEELLFTSDQSIEGIHFLPEQAAAITGHNAL